MSEVAKIAFTDYEAAVAAALDAIGAADRLPRSGLVIIKPNLTLAKPPPVTTSAAAAEAVYDYCKAHCGAEVAIGEGTGDGVTADTYRANGYAKLAKRRGIRLIDFNLEPDVTLARPDALQWKQIHLPEVVREAFLISLPVLKDHSFTTTTISMKNLFGLPPGRFYKGNWNKSKLHEPSVHRSIFDVCLYRRPDLCVVDAAVALTGMHLTGRRKKLGLILAGLDCVAVDAVGSKLLGHDPHKIEYLTLANGVLGDMDDIHVLEG